MEPVIVVSRRRAVVAVAGRRRRDDPAVVVVDVQRRTAAAAHLHRAAAAAAAADAVSHVFRRLTGGQGAALAGDKPASRSCQSHTHTHTHTFNGPFSRTTRVSRYQKGKANLDFTEARETEWQWHQLGHK